MSCIILGAADVPRQHLLHSYSRWYRTLRETADPQERSDAVEVLATLRAILGLDHGQALRAAAALLPAPSLN